jgi:hypothetical protein
MKPMFTTAAGLLLWQHSSRVALNGNGKAGRLGRLKSRFSDWVRDFF